MIVRTIQIPGNRHVAIPFYVPVERQVAVRVRSSQEVDVFVMDSDDLLDFRATGNFHYYEGAEDVTDVSTQVRLKRGWYRLLIVNWSPRMQVHVFAKLLNAWSRRPVFTRKRRTSAPSSGHGDD